MGSIKLDSTHATAASAAAVLAVTGAMLMWTRKSNSRQSSSTKDTISDTTTKIRLYGFLPLGVYPDSSPSCTKLATYLRMCKAEIEIIPYTAHQFKNSPRKKAPYIQANQVNNGQPLTDSTKIIRRLIEIDPQKYDMDKHLTKQEVVIGTAFKAMIEESLYWTVIVHTRWGGNEYHRVTKPTYFSQVPRIMWPIIDYVLAGKILRDYRGQGTGLMDDEEILERVKTDIDAVSEFLGSKPYFMGDKVSSYDATLYGFMAAALQGDWEGIVKDEVKSKQNLVEYLDRMSKEFWPELQMETTTASQ